MANGSPVEGTPRTLPNSEDFRAFYDRTSRTGYGLALRIAGNAERAGAALEASYARVWNAAAGSPDLEHQLLAQVREEALQRRMPGGSSDGQSVGADSTYTFTTAIRDGFAQVDPLGRRAVELAYFGGVGVTEVADILGQPATTVRAAMRRALLALGSLVHDEHETR